MATSTPPIESNISGSLPKADLAGKRVLILLFSHYPGDARPRRAAEAMVERGMKVELVCLQERDDEPKFEKVNGLEVRRLSLRRQRGGKFAYFRQYGLFLAWTFLITAWRTCRRRYDIVHVHNMPDVLAFSALPARLRGAKVILDLHDPMPELMMTIFGLREASLGVRVLKFLEKLSIGLVHRVLTVNRTCQKIFARRSCPLEKIQVVMNSPDEKIFGLHARPAPALRDDHRPFVILYHGSIVERNGLDLAVEALALVRERIPHAELWICGGRNAFLESVLARAETAGLASAVHFLGSKTHEQIAEEIDRCDVGIIPNRRNTFTELNTPTRIFEYLSRGKPVIAPRAPGILDYFDDAQIYFFALGDTADLARQIASIHAAPEEVERVVAAGQAVYRNHLWSRERERFLEVVGELVSK